MALAPAPASARVPAPASARVFSAAHARSASLAVHVASVVSLGANYGAGVTTLADRYVFAGTSSRRTLEVIDQASNTLLTSLQLPGLTPYGIVPLNMDMTDLAFSPDNRTLYILNRLRNDIAVLDVTGATAPRAIALPNNGNLWTRLVVSPNGRALSVWGGAGVTFVDTQTGRIGGTVPWARAFVWGARGTFFALSIHGARGAVGLYDAQGRLQHRVALPAGTSETTPTGSLALSPNGATLYVLWNGLRAIDTATGRIVATLNLPPAPAYIGLAVAPNGRQAMIWAPSVAVSIETPSVTSGYVDVLFGFAGGSVQPIALPSLRPAPADASLRTLSGPLEVAYSGDSSRAYVASLKTLAVLSTGTSGPDLQPRPRVDLQQMLTGPTLHCAAWNISGPWTFSVLPGAPLGSGSGPATLVQDGPNLGGTITLGGAVSYRLAGTLTGQRVSLTLSAPGLVASTFRGEIQPNGASIVGDVGIFRGHASCGTPHQHLPGSEDAPSGAPTPGPGQPMPQPTQACQWNVSGPWTFTAASTSMIGNGSGQATFTQSGSDLSGTLALAGTTYTIKGTIAGNAVTLMLSAPGLVDTTLNGTIAADGGSIDVGMGVFQGKAACGS